MKYKVETIRCDGNTNPIWTKEFDEYGKAKSYASSLTIDQIDPSKSRGSMDDLATVNLRIIEALDGERFDPGVLIESLVVPFIG
jgi:hypothetical protein